MTKFSRAMQHLILTLHRFFPLILINTQTEIKWMYNKMKNVIVALTFSNGWLLCLSHTFPFLSFQWLSTACRLILYFTSPFLCTFSYNLHMLALTLSPGAHTLTKSRSFIHSLETLAVSKCHS